MLKASDNEPSSSFLILERIDIGAGWQHHRRFTTGEQWPNYQTVKEAAVAALAEFSMLAPTVDLADEARALIAGSAYESGAYLVVGGLSAHVPLHYGPARR